MPAKKKSAKQVEALRHDEAKRTNIPTAEYSSAMEDDDRSPIEVAYERRNRDLDPQLVWRGKDEQDLSDLVVQAPPLYIQEKVHPKALIDDLLRRSEQAAKDDAVAESGFQSDLFADFNGLPEGADRTDFYEHAANWSNRMILGDSLQVMASLAEREGLRGKVQCIYIDPPYGIKFNSNFQWSTTSRDVRDGSAAHITREPEQVKAFRDTWRDGIHSYFSYLRDRLEIARDLLTDSGSVFVQIGDENVHRVRALMDEVFGEGNFVTQVTTATTTSSSSQFLDTISDFVLWYAKDRTRCKYRSLFSDKSDSTSSDDLYRHTITIDGRAHRNSAPASFSHDEVPRSFRIGDITSQTQASTTRYEAEFEGRRYPIGRRQWATPPSGMTRLVQSSRVIISGRSLAYIRLFDDYPVIPLKNIWTDTGTGSFTDPKIYVVQTNAKIVQRCILMSTDAGDLVLDPTCGSGTAAYMAEQWGRRGAPIFHPPLECARAELRRSLADPNATAPSGTHRYAHGEHRAPPPADGV